MARDSFQFLVIFGIVFLAFVSGITELYAPYALGKPCSCNSSDVCNEVSKLSSYGVDPFILTSVEQLIKYGKIFFVSFINSKIISYVSVLIPQNRKNCFHINCMHLL